MTSPCVGCGRQTSSTVEVTINGRTGPACGWCCKSAHERGQAHRRNDDQYVVGQQTYDPNED